MLPVLMLIITSTLTQIEGLKCFQCKYSPDIMGYQGGCKDEISMQKYLAGCKPPPSSKPINPTNHGVTISNSKHHSSNNPRSKPVHVTSVATAKPPANVTGSYLGYLYCFTQTSLLNGHLLIEHGCGPSKTPVDLHNTCDKIADKNSSSLNVTQAKICYCGDGDGCNGKLHAGHQEVEHYLQSSNSSKFINDNESKTHEMHRNNTSDAIPTSQKDQTKNSPKITPGELMEKPEISKKENVLGEGIQSNRTKNRKHSIKESSEEISNVPIEPPEMSKAVEKSKASMVCAFVLMTISLSV